METITSKSEETSNPYLDAAKAITGQEDIEVTQEETSKKEEATPEVKVQDQQTRKAFYALSKKDKQLREERKQLDLSKKEHEEQLSEFKKMRQVLGEAKANPHKLLELAGIEFKDTVEYYLQNQEGIEESKLTKIEKKLSDFEKRQEEEKQKIEQEKMNRANAQAVETFHGNILNFAKQNADEYELTLHNWDVAKNLAAQYAISYYNETGESASEGQILKAIETLYEQQINSVLGLKKITEKYKSLSRPQPHQVGSGTESTGMLDNLGTSKSHKKTLNNRLSQSSLIGRKETPEERMAKAIALLNF